MAAGQLDAIAVWFDLILDSQNSFSTGPSWDISWEQAIFPTGQEDIHLQAGDVVRLHASCSDTLLQMEIEGVSRQVESLNKSGDEAAELNHKLHPEDVSSETGLFYVERSELCRWNDKNYLECYRRALAEAVEAVKNCELEESESEAELSGSAMEEEEDLASCLVLDMTHGLSPFGLMAAKEGECVSEAVSSSSS